MPLQGSKIKPKILAAATALFGTWGSKGVTYAAIARKAGCMPAGIFRLFKDQKKLYTEAVATVLADMEKAMTAFALSLVTGDSEQDRTVTAEQAVDIWYKGLSRDGARLLLQVILSDPKRKPEVDTALDVLPRILVQTLGAKAEGGDAKRAKARAEDLVRKLFFLKCTHSGTPDAEQSEVDRHFKEWLKSDK